jgi:C4-dicarboxylate-specific signal transduction histidine kinase
MLRTSQTVVAALILFAATLAQADSPQPGRVPSPDGWHVLVLMSDESLTPAAVEFLDGFREAWRQYGDRVTIQTRHLDVARFAGPENDRELAKFWADRYRHTRIDAVVSAGRPASAFLLEHGSSIWPRARRVFAAVPEGWAGEMPLPGDVVITTKPQYRLTAEGALHLLPDIRQVFLIAGSTDSDRRWLQAAEADLRTLDSRLAVHEIAGLSWEDVLGRVRTLPPDSVALAVVFFADATGRTFVSRDAYADLATAANRPMFVTSSTGIGAGLVGGLVVDYQRVGRRAAAAVAGGLTRKSSESSPANEAAESRWMFDARQLARWGIRESTLPAGSAVLFREPSFFQRYKHVALVILAVLAVQATIIGMLLIERRVRRRVEVQNHAVLASMSADLAVIDRRGVVENNNDGWARAAAAAENPFVSSRRGQPWLKLDGLPPGEPVEMARVRDALRAVLERREEEHVVEYAWLANGEGRWSHLRVRRLLGSAGAVVTHIDITARKHAEIEVQRSLHELAHVNMRSGMGEVLASVAHEVSQPLTSSLTNAQALKRLIAADRAEPQEINWILDDIIESDRRAIDVLDGIRRMLRKEAFDLQPLNLNAVVGDVVRLLTASAANDGVLLVADFQPALPPVRGDRVQLQQVAMNLINNAVQAARGHAVQAPVVRVATVRDNGHVAMLVDDTGAGVDQSDLPRLFEPFFSTKRDGLGVGLSISRSIVEMHGGHIEVTNLARGGARFAVTIPAES